MQVIFGESSFTAFCFAGESRADSTIFQKHLFLWKNKKKKNRERKKKKSHVSKSTKIQLALCPEGSLAAHLGSSEEEKGGTSPLLTQREALHSHSLSTGLSADWLHQKALALSSIKMSVHAVKATEIFPKPQKSLTNCDFLHQLWSSTSQNRQIAVPHSRDRSWSCWQPTAFSLLSCSWLQFEKTLESTQAQSCPEDSPSASSQPWLLQHRLGPRAGLPGSAPISPCDFCAVAASTSPGQHTVAGSLSSFSEVCLYLLLLLVPKQEQNSRHTVQSVLVLHNWEKIGKHPQELSQVNNRD